MMQTAKKRRYSSTAVGFPIRHDLSAYSQGVSRLFPSWERARRAPTYERAHENCTVSTYEPLHQSQRTTCKHPEHDPNNARDIAHKTHQTARQTHSSCRRSTPKARPKRYAANTLFVGDGLQFTWESLGALNNYDTIHIAPNQHSIDTHSWLV